MAPKNQFRRKFDPEFKIRAVKMVLEEHLPLAEVARRLEVHQGQVMKWKQEYLQAGEKDAFPGKGHQKAQDEELKRLRKDLADAQEERDILKKALAIFSKTRD
jgi:transposase